MPIVSSHNAALDTCHLREWVVEHEDELAKLIAKMALGRASHVAKIVSKSPTPEPKYLDDAIVEAVKKLTVEPGEDPWHRDGLMFQYISWIAARIEYPKSLAVLPHQITASKGLDGLLVNVGDDLTVDSIIICEDKATDNPRKTVEEDVWPEFTKFDAGYQDSIIVSAAESVLAGVIGLDADAVTAELDWYGERRYRVSIATSKEKMPAREFKTLFKGFDTTVSGEATRRFACTMILQNLRAELQALAEKAIEYVESWRPELNV